MVLSIALVTYCTRNFKIETSLLQFQGQVWDERNNNNISLFCWSKVHIFMLLWNIFYCYRLENEKIVSDWEEENSISSQFLKKLSTKEKLTSKKKEVGMEERKKDRLASLKTALIRTIWLINCLLQCQFFSSCYHCGFRLFSSNL